MIVDNALGLYTYVLGWALSTGLWALLAGTGIVLIPFVAIVINGMTEAYRLRQEDRLPTGFFYQVELQLYLAFFVMLLFVAPMIEISPTNVEAVDLTCEMQSDGTYRRQYESYTRVNMQSSYDRNDGYWLDNRQARVPLGWYFWDYVTSAAAYTSRSLMPCGPNLRRMSTSLAESRIYDPSLRDEMGQFNRDCYIPSLNRYMQTKPEIHPNILQAVGGTERGVAADIRWPGSLIFQADHRFYPHFRTREGLTSFEYEPNRDMAIASSGILTGNRGYPFCFDWWRGDLTGIGLRQRLIDHFRTGQGADATLAWNEMFEYLFSSGVMDTYQGDPTDLVLRTRFLVMTDTGRLPLTNARMNDTNSQNASPGGRVNPLNWDWTRGAATLFTAALSVPNYVETEVKKEAGPMIRDILLMVIAISTPFLLLVSGYSLRAVTTLALVKFSIMFWTFWFALAAWLDNFLLNAVAGGSTTDANNWMGFINGIASQDGVAVETLRWISRAMYILLPVVFTYLLTMVGLKANDIGGFATGRGAGADGAAGAASRGTGNATNAATRGAGGAMSKGLGKARSSISRKSG